MMTLRYDIVPSVNCKTQFSVVLCTAYASIQSVQLRSQYDNWLDTNLPSVIKTPLN